MVTDKDKEFAGHLVRNLEGANQAVPQALMDLAMQVMKSFIYTWENLYLMKALILFQYYFRVHGFENLALSKGKEER